MDFPVLLLWADEDAAHPLAIAEAALDLFPDAHLRVLPRTGFLIAYDDPVGSRANCSVSADRNRYRLRRCTSWTGP